MNLSSICTNSLMTETCAKDIVTSLNKVFIIIGLMIFLLLAWMNFYIILGTKKKTAVYFIGVLIPSLILLFGYIGLIIALPNILVNLI